MVFTVVLLGLLLVATVTDLRRRRVYNWTTYSGILTALIVNGSATVSGADLEATWNGYWGLVGLADSIAGLLACGFAMLVCYVFFPGGVGGGDVKLIAMMGTFLGLHRGLEAMLWTFVLSGGVALVLLIWRIGALRLLWRGAQWLYLTLRYRTRVSLPDEERHYLKTDVFLAPSALMSVFLVQLELIHWV